jgi:hypothetical protein
LESAATQTALARPPHSQDRAGQWDGVGLDIARATRTWIQYGTVSFAVLCIIIGAVEGLFGR